jgi:ankyrin repeat protein
MHKLVTTENVQAMQAAFAQDPESVNRLNESGLPPLYTAALYRNLQAIDLLLEHGAVVDIFACAFLGKAADAEILLKQNPELARATTPTGMTALHYAVRGGKLPLIKLLLERGARVDALDEDGLTPLLHLSKTRSKADPIPVMELLAASGANIDARDETQGTLLMYFARQGKAEPVQWLLAHGADRNARNNNGKTAAEFGRTHAGIVRLLTK